MKPPRVEPSALALATIMPIDVPCPAELYRIKRRPYANHMASGSNQATVEITLLVLLIILVLVTVFAFLA